MKRRTARRLDPATVKGMEKEIRWLKQLVSNLEAKIETYEKGNHDRQSGDVLSAGHRPAGS